MRYILAIALMLMPHTGVLAGENVYCIHCSEPEQVYRCRVNSANRAAADGPLRLFCSVKIAEEGSHSSCSASRNQQEDCAGGTEVAYTYSGPDTHSWLQPANPGTKASDKQDARPGPDTMVELGRQAAEKSKERLDDVGRTTGDILGKAAKQVSNAVEDVGSGISNTVKNVAKGVSGAAENVADFIADIFR
jgi:hypothetical protein